MEESLIERAQFALNNPDVLHTPDQYRQIIKGLLAVNNALAGLASAMTLPLATKVHLHDATVEGQDVNLYIKTKVSSQTLTSEEYQKALEKQRNLGSHGGALKTDHGKGP